MSYPLPGIAQAFKHNADELPLELTQGKTFAAPVAPIAHSGQVCADELPSVKLNSYSLSREDKCSSCSSRSSPVSYLRKELARAAVR